MSLADAAETAIVDDTPPEAESAAVGDQAERDIDSVFTDAMRAGDAGDATGDAGEPAADPPINSSTADGSQGVTDAAAESGTPAEGAPIDQSAAQPADEVLSGLRSAAQRLGVQIDDSASSEDLALAALRQLHEAQPMINLARQTLAGQVAPAPAQPASAPDPNGNSDWDPKSYFQEKFGGQGWQPEFTQAVQSGMVVRDEATRLWKPAAGYELAVGSVIGPMNEAENRNNQFWTELSRSNPLEQFYDHLMPAMQRAWKADMEQHLSQREQATSQQGVIESFESQNASWLYREDPVSGQHVPTEQGQAMISAITELRESGIHDPQQLLKLSLRITGMDKQVAPQGALQATPALSPVAPSAAAIPPATAPTAGQPAPPADQPDQGPKPSFLESARESALRRASHSPSVNSHENGSGVPQDMTEGDLNNLFVRAIAGSQI